MKKAAIDIHVMFFVWEKFSNQLDQYQEHDCWVSEGYVLFCFGVLGLELSAYNFSHSTSPFL
jgi:hypothetical protein